MTLNKKIEAAKEALIRTRSQAFIQPSLVEQAISSLPEPMSEDAIGEIIANTIMLVRTDSSRDTAQAIIEQLKSAGCLLVRE